MKEISRYVIGEYNKEGKHRIIEIITYEVEKNE